MEKSPFPTRINLSLSAVGCTPGVTMEAFKFENEISAASNNAGTFTLLSKDANNFVNGCCVYIIVPHMIIRRGTAMAVPLQKN